MCYIEIGMILFSLLMLVNIVYVGFEIYDFARAYINRSVVIHSEIKYLICGFPVLFLTWFFANEGHSAEREYRHADGFPVFMCSIVVGVFLGFLWPIAILAAVIIGIIMFLRHQKDLEKQIDK